MTWLNLFFFTFACFGFFSLIKISVRGTRFSVKPLNCAVCMGFWTGSGMAFYFFPGIVWWESFVYGFFISGTNWLLSKIITGEF